MPELPEMQALAERLDARLRGATCTGYQPLGFSSLKTVRPPAEELVGVGLERVGRRAKYLVFFFVNGLRVALHLSQAGRLDLEIPGKSTHPPGSVVRLEFGEATSVLVREYGRKRKAGWWVLGPEDDGPLASLGPEPDDPAFTALLEHGDSNQHLHTMLRDQHIVAGIGRGYADDALHRAGLSPFASLRSLTPLERTRLLQSIHGVLDEALERERTREGGLSEAKLGERFAVHNRSGQPCPTCGEELRRVSYDSYEIVYCSRCQTAGKVLADRRLSRLLR